MAQTKNRRTASVARRTQPNNRRSNTRQQSNSPQSTPTQQGNALSRVVDHGYRFSPLPRTRGALRAEEERLLVENEDAMNGPPDLERALTELVAQSRPAGVPAAAPTPEQRCPCAAP